MQWLYQAIVVVHIIAGAIGLLSLAVPLATRKGSAAHRGAGWVFVVAMALAVTCSLVIATSWLIVPLWVKPSAAGHLGTLRTFGAFFGLLGLSGGNALLSGLAAIGRRRLTSPWLPRAARISTWALVLAAPAVVWLGFISGSVLLIAFGTLFTIGAVTELRRPAISGRATMVIAHLEAMLGAATVATTAFTVQFVSRIDAASEFSLWAWMAPVGAGMLATIVWRRRAARERYHHPA